MQERQIEILHKQLKSVMVLITQNFKNDLESNGNETKHFQQNKKANILHNAILV